jgi:hypothetical protein
MDYGFYHVLRNPFNNDESKARIHVGNAVFSHDCFQIGGRNEDKCACQTIFQCHANVDIIITAVGDRGNLRWIKNGILHLNCAVSRIGERRLDLLDMFEVTGFYADSDVTACDRHIGVGAFVTNGGDVRTALRNRIAEADELTGLIIERNEKSSHSAGGNETSGDNAGEDVYVDITAGNEAGNLFALDGKLAEHSSGNGNSTRALGNEFLLFDHGENCRRDLVLGNGHDIVNVFLNHLEGGVTGVLDGNTVSEGGNGF